MKKNIIGMLFGAVLVFSAMGAHADDKYVQSAGSSVFTIDREAGTITRQIRASIQGSILQSETLSCKYGYIVTINGASVAMLDLLAPTNDLSAKRLEYARKDCLAYNMEARF